MFVFTQLFATATATSATIKATDSAISASAQQATVMMPPLRLASVS